MNFGKVTLRHLRPDDEPLLHEMFLETLFWRQDTPRLQLGEVLATPELAKYIVDWGRSSDAGVVAVADSLEPLGAAWFRLFTTADRGYGFVSEDIPELGIAVKTSYRGRGVGRRLMKGLISLARERGLKGLSLSVEDENSRAVRLYTGIGFVRVERVQTAWTMVLRLGE